MRTVCSNSVQISSAIPSSSGFPTNATGLGASIISSCASRWGFLPMVPVINESEQRCAVTLHHEFHSAAGYGGTPRCALKSCVMNFTLSPTRIFDSRTAFFCSPRYLVNFVERMVSGCCVGRFRHGLILCLLRLDLDYETSPLGPKLANLVGTHSCGRMRHRRSLAGK